MTFEIMNAGVFRADGLYQKGGGLEIPKHKPNLSTIRQQYQVEEEDTVAYRPRLFGQFDIPFTGTVMVTKTEAELLDQLTFDRGLLGLKGLDDLKNEVFDVAEERYPAPSSAPPWVPADPTDPDENRVREWGGNDGHQDAFRHAYWNARMAKEYGQEWTEQFATAHEGLAGNPATREAMDLYNNEVGRQIAAEHPNASDEALAALVQQAVEDGRLLVVDAQGDLAWSNEVPVGEHGLADPDQTLDGYGQIQIPDGDARPDWSSSP